MEPREAADFESFCVVVPMYNEAVGAELCVKRICKDLSAIAYRCELVVVEDGSSDATASILDRLSAEFGNLTVINHASNSGYGAALRSGMEYAISRDFDYALFMDSDLTNDPADIPRFVEKMRAGYDVIKATRYSDGGTVIGVPAYRVLISRAGNLIARILFRLPISDCTNGFRALRTRLLAQMRLTENKFPIIMEELYYCAFLTDNFTQIPVKLTNRQLKQRPTSFGYRPHVFYSYLKYPLRAFRGIKPLGMTKEDEKK